MIVPNENQIGKLVIHSAIRIHQELGPGLLESAYQSCLAFELHQQGLSIEKEVPLPVIYKQIKLDCGYRLDLWIEGKVILEIKAVERLQDVHLAQILTYLKLTNNKLGYLLNFNTRRMKDGIKRVVNGL